jgi:predicted phage replisome organizer
MPSSVKWIRLDLGLFDHQKIKYLRTLPEGDSLVLFWIYLLSRAGRCNDNGCVYITENVPYNIDSLSKEGGFAHSTVRLAMDLFNKMGMIDIEDNGYIYVNGWAEYQNYDALAKRRESDRIRQHNSRALRKQLSLPIDVTLPSRDTEDNVTVTPSVTLPSRDNLGQIGSESGGHVMVTGQSRDISIIKEKEELELDSTNVNKDISKKNKNGKVEFSTSVFLTDEEYRRLVERFGESLTKDKIEALSLYIQSKGAKYKSHYATILVWDRNDKNKQQFQPPTKLKRVN